MLRSVDPSVRPSISYARSSKTVNIRPCVVSSLMPCAAECRCPVVSNFRAKDVALGGQGAPLVSLGEAHLFSGYDVLVNLGGIANVSVVGSATHGCSGSVAFDVCPCNMLLNHLAQRLPVEVAVMLRGNFKESR